MLRAICKKCPNPIEYYSNPDYLDGDTYYKIEYAEHNIVRSRAQFKFLQELEKHFDEMQSIVLQAAEKYKA